MRKTALLAGIAMLAGSTLWAADPQTRWLNVHVVERHDGTEVKVHLPLAMVMTVVESINSDDFQQGKIRIDTGDAEIDWVRIMAELKRAPEGEYITVRQPDANVVFNKKDGLILIDVDEQGEDGDHVEVRLPVGLLDAFAVDGDGQVDVRTLLSRLDNVTTGELIRVTSADANVRIWVE